MGEKILGNGGNKPLILATLMLCEFQKQARYTPTSDGNCEWKEAQISLATELLDPD